MNTTTVRRAGGANHHGKSAATAIVAAACLSCSGCAYMESMMARKPQQPDPRTVLTARDGTVYVSARDLPRFTCVPDLLLVCETFGGPQYLCGCELR